MKYVFSTYALATLLAVSCAYAQEDQTQDFAQASDEIEQTQEKLQPHEHIMYIPEAPQEADVTQAHEDNKPEVALFLKIFTILSSFGELLNSPHDEANVQQHVATMLNTIGEVSQDLSKQENMEKRQSMIVHMLVEMKKLHRYKRIKILQ